jgi:hypothetical protein
MDPTVNPAFVIFAAVAPLLIAFVKQSGLSRQINALIALGCYVVVGILGALLSGEPITLENAVALIATATVVGSAAYNLVWSNLGTTTEDDLSLDDRLTMATSFIK